MKLKNLIFTILSISLLSFFSISCNLIFPNKPPEIQSINIPSEVVEGSSFKCNVNAIDDKGISYYQIEFGSVVASNTSGTFNLTAPDVPFDEVIEGTATVYDLMNYSISKNFSLMVLDSSSAPAIKIVQPSENSQIPLGSQLDIVVNATNIEKVEFYFDSQKIAETNSAPYSTSYSVQSASVHTITVIGYKNTLIVQDSVNISVVENTPPVATVTVSNIVELGENTSINMDAYDENGIAQATLTIVYPGNSEKIENFQNFPQNYILNVNTLGNYSLEFKVADPYNNITIVNKNFIATDTKAPSLYITLPEYSNSSTVNFDFSISDPSTWNGIFIVDKTVLNFSQKVGETSQNISMGFDEGIHFVTLTATDVWGHNTSRSATFVVDTTDPIADISLPSNSNSNSLNITYTATDMWFDHATLYISDIQIPVNKAENENINVDIPTMDGETLNSTLVVVDKTSQTSIATDNVVVDNTLYLLEATYPATTDQKNIVITITVEDKNLDENYLAINTSSNVSSYSVSKTVQTINGKKHMEIDLNVDFTDTDSLENITVGVKDTSGNTKTLNMEIAVDNINQPPQPLNADLYVNTQIGRTDYVLIKFHEKVVLDDSANAILEYKTGSSVYNITNTSPITTYGDDKTIMIEFGELIPSDTSAATVTINGLGDQFGNILTNPVSIDQIHIVNTIAGN